MNTRLLTISYTPHCLKEGRPAGWTATVREIDQLAGIFEQIVHIAPFYDQGSPGSADFYKAKNVVYKPVKPAGGKKLIDKIGIFLRIPEYISIIFKELKNCDVVHVRCPSSISLIALFMLMFLKFPQKRWIKYAGDWSGGQKEAVSYSLQRWILKNNFTRALVTINGEWPNQPKHISSFLNPCISEIELAQANLAGIRKIFFTPVRLLFVGRIETEKGIGTALQILARLRDKHTDSFLDIVGDGPECAFFKKQAQDLNFKNIFFHGWLLREDLNTLYNQAHFLILPSLAGEGWPKVLSEAMAFGALPLASPAGSIPQYLKKFAVGKILPVNDVDPWCQAIMDYMKNPEIFESERGRAMKAAKNFTYEIYLRKIRVMLSI